MQVKHRKGVKGVGEIAKIGKLRATSEMQLWKAMKIE